MGFSVSNSTYLYQFTSGYIFRFCIPKDLRGVVGKVEFRYSLRSGILKVAKHRARCIASYIHQLFVKLRSNMSDFSTERIDQLVREYIRQTKALHNGKTYLACAFAQKACREGFNTLYLRMTKLFKDLSLSKGDGRYLKLLSSFAKADLLVLDDLEILEDRHGLKSTLVNSQLPIDHWHEQIGDPTLADAILDRLVHSAHKIKLNGESMRKKNANLTQTAMTR
jgi:hypothetical protein